MKRQTAVEQGMIDPDQTGGLVGRMNNRQGSPRQSIGDMPAQRILLALFPQHPLPEGIEEGKQDTCCPDQTSYMAGEASRKRLVSVYQKTQKKQNEKNGRQTIYILFA